MGKIYVADFVNGNKKKIWIKVLLKRVFEGDGLTSSKGFRTNFETDIIPL